jgi:ketosteroid isomerase-like protein
MPRTLRMSSLRLAAAVVAAFALLRGAAAAPAPPPPSRAELVGLVTRTLKSWETGDAAAFTSAFTDDAVWAYPGGRIRRGSFADTFNGLCARKRDIRIYVGDFIVQGAEFAVQYQFAATDRKTGRRWAVGTGVRGMIRDGRIAVIKEYWDEHIPVGQAANTLPLDEGEIFPAPASVVMTGERIN